MRDLGLFVPWDANIASLGRSFKCDVWDLAAAGVSLVSNLAGNAQNISAASDLNEENREWQHNEAEIARQYNTSQTDLAWQRQQAQIDKLNQLQIDAENRERSYNDPAAQVARLRRAGINPYLAMQQGQLGNVSSSRGPSAPGSVAAGSAPSAGTPQTFLPDYSGFGRGISDAASIYFQSRSQDREDYRLAGDLTFADNKQKLDAFNHLLELRKEGANEKWINYQMESLMRSFKLDQDRFEHQKEIDDFNSKIDQFRADTERISVGIQRQLAGSQISVNQATINRIAAEVAVCEQEVKEMKLNGVSQRRINKYIAAREKEVSLALHEDNQLRKDLYGSSGDRSVPQRIALGVKNGIEFLFAPIKGIVSVSK